MYCQKIGLKQLNHIIQEEKPDIILAKEINPKIFTDKWLLNSWFVPELDKHR